MALREDSRLIMLLARQFGLKTALSWQQAPHLEVPAQWRTESTRLMIPAALKGVDPNTEEGVLRVLSHFPAEGDPEFPREMAEVKEGMATLEQSVWEDFCMVIPKGHLGQRASGWRWSRLRLMKEASRLPGSPWIPASQWDPLADEEGSWLLLETLIVDQRRLRLGSGELVKLGLEVPRMHSIAIDRNRPWDAAGVKRLGGMSEADWRYLTQEELVMVDRREDGGPDLATMSKAQARILVFEHLTLLWQLIFGEAHPVEVVPEPRPPRPGEQYRNRVRPWLREDLPRVVMIEPVQEEEGTRVAASESGRKVRGHHRRGHWRELRAERFHRKRRLWVRPAWVGPREWRVPGQIYRVVTDQEGRIAERRAR